MTQDFDQIYLTCYQVVYRYALTLTGTRPRLRMSHSKPSFRLSKKSISSGATAPLKAGFAGSPKITGSVSCANRNTGQTLLSLNSSPAVWKRCCSTGEMSDRLFGLLHQLEEPYREVFWLRVFGERSFREIAGLFGKTESWARVTYHRAKARLQERMNSE